jgi:hypothetical protein
MFKPVGVLPAVPSGWTLRVGLKSSFSQPDSGGRVTVSSAFEGGSAAGFASGSAGSPHDSTLNLAVRDTPHEVGFVNNGTTG